LIDQPGREAGLQPRFIGDLALANAISKSVAESIGIAGCYSRSDTVGFSKMILAAGNLSRARSGRWGIDAASVNRANYADLCESKVDVKRWEQSNAS
jgi:hypothetical protein